jgi:hypothetical protein
MDAAGNKSGGRRRGTTNQATAEAPALPPSPLAPPPTPEQQARIDQARKRSRGAARFSIRSRHEKAGENAEVSSPHSDFEGWRLTEQDAFGTTSDDFAAQLFGEVGWVTAVKPGVLNQQATNSAFAAIDGAEPKNELEAMLVAQMACTHNVAMAILGRVKQANTIPGMQEYGTLANKLLRTYAAQIEVASQASARR